MDINTLEKKLGIANLSDTEKLALVRGIESNVQASKAAVKAQEAGQYASLVVDAIKKIKSDLEARFNELNGIIDVKAKVLKDGKDGIDGKDGKNGVDGKDGKDGLSITGPKGADGEDGKDGVGVQDAHIDFDGSLIITLTNGKELNVGEVVPFDVAEKIKVIGNGGGTSQSVLDSIAALTTAITTNVAITGGTIDNTVIGGTTPAAGTFTTLISNSTAQFGKSSANYVQAVGGATTVAPVVSALGSDTNIPLVLQPKGTGALQAQQTDSATTGGNARGANAVDWQMLRNTAAKVASNAYTVIAGGASNSAVGFAGAVLGGTDNQSGSGNYNIVAGGYLNTAGQSNTAVVGGYGNSASGYFNFIGSGYANAGTSGSTVTTQSATMNGTTAVTLSGSNANIKVGQLITGTSINTFPHTYVAAVSGTSLTLSQAATGSSTSTLSFYTPHGVVVGGGNNQATGSYSFIGGGGDAGTASNRNVASGDWSVVAGGQKNVASGLASFIGGGGNDGSLAGNTASGTASAVLGGGSNQASSTYSAVGGGKANIASGNSSFIAGGIFGTTRGITGNTVFTGNYTSLGTYANGNAQCALLVLARQTTDATPTVLCSSNSAASNINQVILPNNSAYYFRGTVVAGVTGGGNTKGWTVEGVIKRGANAASTTVVGVTVASMYADAGAVTWTIGATADTTNGGLAITFTGQAATTIRCVAKIETTECTY